MNLTRAFVAAAVILTGVTAFEVAFAQALAPTDPSSKQSVAKRVETWTTEQWNAAKKKSGLRIGQNGPIARNNRRHRSSQDEKGWSFLY